jgi:hypothetical protein
MVAAMSYALCVNFVSRYRIPADALGDSSIGQKNNQAPQSDIEAKQMDPNTGKLTNEATATEVEKR